MLSEMPEITIRYKSTKTLQALKEFARLWDFIIYPAKSEKELSEVNGVTIIPADNSVDTTSLFKIFTGKKIDAKELRSKWQRR